MSELIQFSDDVLTLEVEYDSNSFRPNRVSKAFANAMPKDLTSLVVDDIGSGGGVLAIIEAKRGAREVRAVEPAPANFELLVRNIQRYGYGGIIRAYKGVFFDPLKYLAKADIISADVSGIPETFGRALGWYPEGIETGGEKGTEITCELLRRAPYYIKRNGRLYFPTANDLLDAEEILQVARENFGYVENALCSDEQLTEWKQDPKSDGKLSPDYVWFQLRKEDIEKLETAYFGKIPSSINIQQIKGRFFWRGQIYVAAQPKLIQ